MSAKGKSEPRAFSVKEFAALFDKEQTWGYRQLYSGKVNSITEFGRILIPASEVERILATAGRYDGVKKQSKRTKSGIEALKPKLKNAWQKFIRSKRNGRTSAVTARKRGPSSASENPQAREAALKRLQGNRR